MAGALQLAALLVAAGAHVDAVGTDTPSRHGVAMCGRTDKPSRDSNAVYGQGLTLVHFSAQREHSLWDTLGA